MTLQDIGAAYPWRSFKQGWSLHVHKTCKRENKEPETELNLSSENLDAAPLIELKSSDVQPQGGGDSVWTRCSCVMGKCFPARYKATSKQLS